ncbi:MAG: methyltransferase domain-containing protein [Chitinophagales bacterium]|nr:methyltransferase domain-containing protein [Chitinophagales bacterium]MDW8393159.1 methyltransferase domain-containing protein [Chitinophagales bacterium]
MTPVPTNSKSPPWYEHWFGTPYYRMLYAHRDEQEAARFIDQLLPLLNLPATARILDVGCGDGRHARVLAAYGFEVTGIDLSAENIARARQYAGPRLAFFLHDMRQLLHVNYYDAVFNLFTSFGYFSSDTENARALRNMILALKDGGKLVIDFLNVHYVRKTLISEEVVHRGDVAFTIRRRFEQGSRPVIVKEITIHETGAKPRQFTERVQAYTLSDFEKWFKKSGLKLQAVYGSYDLDPYQEPTSPRLIMLAERQIA